MGATPRNRVAEILIRAKVIDDMQSRSAQAHVERWGLRFTAALIDLGLADEDMMVDKLCAGTGTKRANLGTWQKDENVLGMIDVETCEEKGVFPMAVKNRVLTLAMANPTDVLTIDELTRETRVSRIMVMTAGERELLAAISRHYHGVEPQQNQQMIRKQTRSSDPDELPPEEEEFKVTDMSGKTVMKSASDIAAQMAALRAQLAGGGAPAAAAPPAPAPAPPPAPAPVAAAPPPVARPAPPVAAPAARPAPPVAAPAARPAPPVAAPAARPAPVAPPVARPVPAAPAAPAAAPVAAAAGNWVADLPEADLQRVKALKEAQDRAGLVVRALALLLAEKGYSLRR
ncbi:MAG: hypothetical protein RL653_1912 [Pseudomonadota bacterium]